MNYGEKKECTVLSRMIENLVLQSINGDELHFHTAPGILRDKTMDNKCTSLLMINKIKLLG